MDDLRRAERAEWDLARALRSRTPPRAPRHPPPTALSTPAACERRLVATGPSTINGGARGLGRHVPCVRRTEPGSTPSRALLGGPTRVSSLGGGVWHRRERVREVFE